MMRRLHTIILAEVVTDVHAGIMHYGSIMGHRDFTAQARVCLPAQA